MRVGFVGLGLIGARRLQIAREMGCEIAFAIDPDTSRRELLGLNDNLFLTDFFDLAAANIGNLDAIFVAVPHDLALPVCDRAFSLGAHVLCEKPMGLSHSQALKIEALAKAANRKFGAGFNKRFLPGVSALKKLVDDGAFGKFHRMRIAMAHGGRPGMEKEWKLKRSRAGGGALIDPGIHLIDLTRYIFSDAIVEGYQLSRRFWDVDVEDNCTLRLRCGEADVTIEVSLTSWKNVFEIEVLGSDGYAKVVGQGGNYGEQTIEYANRWFWNGDDRRLEKSFGLKDQSFDLETKAFLNWASGGALGPSLSTAKDGIEALSIVDQFYLGVHTST